MDEIGENWILMDKIGVKNRIEIELGVSHPPVPSKLPTDKAIVLTSLTS